MSYGLCFSIDTLRFAVDQIMRIYKVECFLIFFIKSLFFYPAVKTKMRKLFFKMLLFGDNLINAQNLLPMTINIPDFYFLTKLMNMLSHFWVIQVWRVGLLQAAHFLSDMSISSSFSLVPPSNFLVLVSYGAFEDTRTPAGGERWAMRSQDTKNNSWHKAWLRNCEKPYIFMQTL